jgi:hypothetical protein
MSSSVNVTSSSSTAPGPASSRSGPPSEGSANSGATVAPDARARSSMAARLGSSLAVLRAASVSGGALQVPCPVTGLCQKVLPSSVSTSSQSVPATGLEETGVGAALGAAAAAPAMPAGRCQLVSPVTELW